MTFCSEFYIWSKMSKVSANIYIYRKKEVYIPMVVLQPIAPIGIYTSFFSNETLSIYFGHFGPVCKALKMQHKISKKSAITLDIYWTDFGPPIS